MYNRAGEIPKKNCNTLSKWSLYLVMAMQTNKSINHGKRFQFGFIFFWEVLPQYKIEKLASPNLTFPFDYNLLILPVDEEFKVCPTTFIVKILKSRGTSAYWPWS